MKAIYLFATAMFALSSAASYAQDTIGGQQVPEGQAPAIAAHCSELQAQQGTTGTQEPETTLAEEPAGTDANEPAEGDLDVSAITLEQCIDGGFIEEPANTAD